MISESFGTRAPTGASSGATTKAQKPASAVGPRCTASAPTSMSRRNPTTARYMAAATPTAATTPGSQSAGVGEHLNVAPE